MKLPILRTALHLTVWLTIAYALQGCARHQSIIILKKPGTIQYDTIAEGLR